MEIIKEEWRDIPDYEGLYQVSNMGRVKSLKRKGNYKDRILSQSNNNEKKYWRVGLTKNNKKKNFSVHRLVASVFIPNPDNLPQVNHKDENKNNNHVSNLEWVTPKENSNYGTRTERQKQKMINGKLSKPILQYTLDGVFIAEYPSLSEIQRQLNYLESNISSVVTNKTIQAYNYLWFYKDTFTELLLLDRINQLNKPNPISKPIIQYTLDMILIREWDSAKSASTELKINQSNITACCKSKRKSAGEFIWRYKE